MRGIGAGEAVVSVGAGWVGTLKIKVDLWLEGPLTPKTGPRLTPEMSYAGSMSADKLRKEALALPLDERAALAKDLLLSLEENEVPEAGAEEAWAEEIGRRAQAVADGTAVLVDWADAEKRITARLKARREARATR